MGAGGHQVAKIETTTFTVVNSNLSTVFFDSVPRPADGYGYKLFFMTFSFPVIMRFEGPMICHVVRRLIICNVLLLDVINFFWCHLECLAECLLVHKATSVSSCHPVLTKVRMEPSSERLKILRRDGHNFLVEKKNNCGTYSLKISGVLLLKKSLKAFPNAL